MQVHGKWFFVLHLYYHGKNFKQYIFFQFGATATDQGSPSRTGTATVTVNVIRNTGQPTFVTSINYDVTVSESTSVLSTLLQVRAVDSDDANTPNGQIRYSIVSPAVARSFFNIDPVSGNITSRLSLVSVPDDIYTVSSWGSKTLFVLNSKWQYCIQSYFRPM